MTAVDAACALALAFLCLSTNLMALARRAGVWPPSWGASGRRLGAAHSSAAASVDVRSGPAPGRELCEDPKPRASGWNLGTSFIKTPLCPSRLIFITSNARTWLSLFSELASHRPPPPPSWGPPLPWLVTEGVAPG